MSRILVFAIISLCLIGIDLYAYQGLKVAVGNAPLLVQRIAKAVFWGLSALTLLGFVLFEPLSQRPAARTVLTIIMTIGVANILGKLLFALWLVIDDLIRLAKWVWRTLNPSVGSGATGTPIDRSEFLAQAGAITASVPLLGMGWGVFSGAHDYRVIRKTITLRNLPQSFDGFTITQISDLHTGSFWSKSAVERGVRLVNEQGSDVIFFTGDLVNNVASELDGWIDVFSKLSAPQGVFSVLGNHDYGDYVAWSKPEEKEQNLRDLIRKQADMGWDLLMDEHRVIERNGDRLAIVGVQNWGGRGRFPKYGDLRKATSGLDNVPVKLLLSHDPSHWKGQIIPEFGDIDVTFSGHTHGFQFGIEVGSVKWSPVKYFYPEWADLYRKGNQYLYVNRGFGYIGYPGRLGIRPEITVITLKSEPQAAGVG